MLDMKRFTIILLLLGPVILHAQSDRKLIRQGYKSYMDGKYNEAEVDFRKAEDIDKESFTAKYNTSTALFQQEKIEESAKRFEELLAETTNDKDEAMLYHNLGNTFLETDKLKEGIEAYKKSLRLNPEDEDTRYNLTYALEKLQQQQEQQQQDQENKDNKENKDDQEQGDKDKDKQDKQDESEENKDQEQDSGDQNKDEELEQQNQPQPQQLSKEDAERLLDAILQKEKDVKEKVDKKKAAAAKIKTDKDW